MYENQVLLGATQARAGGSGIIGAWEHAPGARGLVVFVNITNINAGVINVMIEAQDVETDQSGSGAVGFMFAQTSNATTNGMKMYVFYPDLPAGASGYTQSMPIVLPAKWRVHINEDSAAKTYGASYEILT